MWSDFKFNVMCRITGLQDGDVRVSYRTWWNSIGHKCLETGSGESISIVCAKWSTPFWTLTVRFLRLSDMKRLIRKFCRFIAVFIGVIAAPEKSGNQFGPGEVREFCWGSGNVYRHVVRVAWLLLIFVEKNNENMHSLCVEDWTVLTLLPRLTISVNVQLCCMTWFTVQPWSR